MKSILFPRKRRRNNKQLKPKKVGGMSNQTKLKILLLGPISSGKTTIANFLSNSTENVIGENRPTKGVRIVEFTAHGVKGKGVFQNSIEIELWDCSGDNRYQSCWPSFRDKTDGIIFVYSETSNHQKTDLEMLYSFFVEEANFPESSCLVVKNESGSENEKKNSENPLPSLTHVNVNFEDGNTEFRKTFNSFLSNIIKANSNN